MSSSSPTASRATRRSRCASRRRRCGASATRTCRTAPTSLPRRTAARTSARASRRSSRSAATPGPVRSSASVQNAPRSRTLAIAAQALRNRHAGLGSGHSPTRRPRVGLGRCADPARSDRRHHVRSTLSAGSPGADGGPRRRAADALRRRPRRGRSRIAGAGSPRPRRQSGSRPHRPRPGAREPHAGDDGRHRSAQGHHGARPRRRAVRRRPGQDALEPRRLEPGRMAGHAAARARRLRPHHRPDTPTDERGFLGAAFSPTFATDGLIYTDTSDRSIRAARPRSRSAMTTTRAWPGSRRRPTTSTWCVSGTSPIRRRRTSLSTRRRRARAACSSRSSTRSPTTMPVISHSARTTGSSTSPTATAAAPTTRTVRRTSTATRCSAIPTPATGQSLDTPLGKMLRIDPHVTGALPEIFASGLRNPFRFSFDAVNGDMWIGNVGQNDVEEVELGAAGANYGWRVKEGTFLFDPGGFQLKGARSDGFPFANSPGAPAGLTDPVAQYDHDEGTAIIGGFVYRGASMPALRGHYVFGDTSRRLNNRHGRLFEFDSDHRSAVTAANTITELRDGPLDAQLIGFGQDADRELYAMVFGSRQFGQTGVVLRLSQAVPATG